MTVSQNHEQLRKQIHRQVRRMEKAQRERATVLSQTVYIGVLGLVFVLPVVGGAYLGRWLDTLVAGYSIRWTLSMLFIGVVVGAVNVYLLVRE
ncbi:MAG: AtpZ/AtpI family protein [Gammaproteobacteria bacterium]|jgi:ATP synthase protein I|nr:AtpZ/AtpI family protein [Gammaproteobacteria bacterium]MDX2461011.1 AtpZ/AtpI family protein [Gammaproteobacteria bacterium]